MMSQSRYVVDAVPFVRSKGSIRLSWSKNRISVPQLVQLIRHLRSCHGHDDVSATESYELSRTFKRDIEKLIKGQDIQLDASKCISLADAGRIIGDVSDLPIEPSDIDGISDELDFAHTGGPASASAASSSSHVVPYALDAASSRVLALAHFEPFSREELIEEVVEKEHQIVELKNEKNQLRAS